MAFYEEFYDAFDALDKEKCVNLAYDALVQKEQSIETLYENILKKALSNISDVETDPDHKIWKEHIQSSIIRTIVEMAFPFVLKERKSEILGKAAVVCPDGEEHELGARMVSDYISLLGYETYFVGKSTPKKEFIDMIKTMDLSVVALSVTNYYNLSQTLKTIQLIRETYPDLTILLGGHGIEANSESLSQYKVQIAHDYKDIRELIGGGVR